MQNPRALLGQHLALTSLLFVGEHAHGQTAEPATELRRARASLRDRHPVTWAFTIPKNTGLCGAELAAQGFDITLGPVSITAVNALTMTVGG